MTRLLGFPAGNALRRRFRWGRGGIIDLLVWNEPVVQCLCFTNETPEDRLAGVETVILMRPRKGDVFVYRRFSLGSLVRVSIARKVKPSLFSLGSKRRIVFRCRVTVWLSLIMTTR